MNNNYKILKAHDDNSTIEVQFFNPYYVEGSADAHVTKTVRVPMTDSGEIDHEGLKLVLEQQMMGVRNRMETAYKQAQAKTVNLSDALGVPYVSAPALVMPEPPPVSEPEPTPEAAMPDPEPEPEPEPALTPARKTTRKKK